MAMRATAVSLIALVLALLAPAANAQIRTEVITAKPPGGISALMLIGARATLKNNHRQYFTVTIEAGAAEFDEIDAPPAQPRRTNMLPDGAVSVGTKNIRAAWLTDPTRRYRHGVIGDAIEAGGLAAETRRGAIQTFKLAKNAVFEDRLARLIDMDDDGRDETLVIKSTLDRGTAIALFKSTNDGLARIAQSVPIGRANRWLNIVGAADFDGDGKKEIAAVITPHIVGRLTLFEVKGDRLAKDGDAFGFSNHAIGSRQLGWSAILDVNGDGVPDMVLPNANRRSLRAVSFAGGFKELATAPVGGNLATAIIAADLDGDGRAEILYGLESGRLKIMRFVR
jgi:hypothetical protein